MSNPPASSQTMTELQKMQNLMRARKKKAAQDKIESSLGVGGVGETNVTGNSTPDSSDDKLKQTDNKNNHSGNDSHVKLNQTQTKNNTIIPPPPPPITTPTIPPMTYPPPLPKPKSIPQISSSDQQSSSQTPSKSAASAAANNVQPKRMATRSSAANLDAIELQDKMNNRSKHKDSSSSQQQQQHQTINETDNATEYNHSSVKQHSNQQKLSISHKQQPNNSKEIVKNNLNSQLSESLKQATVVTQHVAQKAINSNGNKGDSITMNQTNPINANLTAVKANNQLKLSQKQQPLLSNQTPSLTIPQINQPTPLLSQTKLIKPLQSSSLSQNMPVTSKPQQLPLASSIVSRKQSSGSDDEEEEDDSKVPSSSSDESKLKTKKQIKVTKRMQKDEITHQGTIVEIKQLQTKQNQLKGTQQLQVDFKCYNKADNKNSGVVNNHQAPHASKQNNILVVGISLLQPNDQTALSPQPNVSNPQTIPHQLAQKSQQLSVSLPLQPVSSVISQPPSPSLIKIPFFKQLRLIKKGIHHLTEALNGLVYLRKRVKKCGDQDDQTLRQEGQMRDAPEGHATKSSSERNLMKTKIREAMKRLKNEIDGVNGV